MNKIDLNGIQLAKPIGIKTVGSINSDTLNATEIDLYNTFLSSKITRLALWYLQSKEESSLNGKTGQEVGISREFDLKAYLVYCLGKRVNCNIDNHLKEDVLIDGQRISIKHLENKHNTSHGIKVAWTANELKQQEVVDKHQFNCNMLIIYLNWFTDNRGAQLRFFYISKEILQKTKMLYSIQGKNILKPLQKNSRGVEFNPDFFNTIILKHSFKVYVDFTCPCKELFVLDPIQRRLLEADLVEKEYGL